MPDALVLATEPHDNPDVAAASQPDGVPGLVPSGHTPVGILKDLQPVVDQRTGNGNPGQTPAMRPTTTGLVDSNEDAAVDEGAASEPGLMRAGQDVATAAPGAGVGRASAQPSGAVHRVGAPQSRTHDRQENDSSFGAPPRGHSADPDASHAVLQLSAAGGVTRQEGAPSSPMASGAASGRAPAVPLPHVPARVAQIAASLNEPGSRSVRLRLDPPSLGEVRVHVESSAHGVTVRIVAQSHEACALLSDQQSDLSRELWRHGLTLQSFSATLAGDGRHDRKTDRDDASFERRSGAVRSVDGAGAAVPPLHSPLPAARAGRLDARA